MGRDREVLSRESSVWPSQAQRTRSHQRNAQQAGTLGCADSAERWIPTEYLLEIRRRIQMNTAIKPRTLHRDLEHLPAARLPLTQLKHWVTWKWEQTKDSKWTKVPYQPRFYKQHAKSNDPVTGGNYADVVLAFTSGNCNGIGFTLRGSVLGAIDLDKIRDFATGQVLRWAEELFVEAANAGCYLEWTVSGTGARIIGIAKGGELHRKIQINRKNGCAVE